MSEWVNGKVVAESLFGEILCFGALVARIVANDICHQNTKTLNSTKGHTCKPVRPKEMEGCEST